MNENKNPIKKRLTEQLPSHSPDAESWQRLSAKLDALDSTAAYYERLQELPVHSPDKGTWAVIYSRLNRIGYLKTAARVALMAAAGLLLFFSVSRISDYYKATPSIPQLAKHEISNSQPLQLNQPKPAVTQIKETPDQNKIIPAPVSFRNTADFTSAFQEPGVAEIETAIVMLETENAPKTEIPVASENTPGQFVQNTSNLTDSISPKVVPNTVAEPQTAFVLKVPESPATSPALKYYTPKEAKPGTKANHFALAMNYLPENIYNGTNNSLFHNVDLTASYNKEKVRFNTSLGMAYNEEQLEFNMNYDIKSPVTSTGIDGKIDTVGYNVSNMDAQYQGTEKHQFFTYNLGIGRRLFRSGKFSSWFNAGAGFGVKLNNPDLVSSTEKQIKNQYNVLITSASVNTSQPVYNDVNISFVTGIDFSYRILNRLSITVSPTSRWYFKPVLTLDNQPTDELTLGFRTGMKFDF